ncbi:hypothetical protein Q1695_003735 [Nippostrongylus brasiliensis]|nr:hypothetical protein Q1695_003735 [Nippostrongylus brasiliensis]
MSTKKKFLWTNKCLAIYTRMTEKHLFLPGDGLCGTHVSWSDIEEEMQHKLGTSARFGPNKSFKNIADGKGFASKILLIDPDWQPHLEEHPKHFVAKIASLLSGEKLKSKVDGEDWMDDVGSQIAIEKLMKRSHNVEVAIYEKLEMLPEGKLRLPKIYSLKPFSESNPLKGYIIMEYVENAEGAPMYSNCTPESLKPVLRYIAVLTANFLDVSLHEAEIFPKTPFKDMWSSEQLHQMWNASRLALRPWAGGKFTEKADRLEQIAPSVFDTNRADNMAEECGMNRVLCHGDLWPGNVLWRSEGGEFHCVTVVDFQGAHFGCTATDFVRLFSLGLSGSDRRKHWEELMEVFYKYLEEEVGDRAMPYTLEQLKEAYRRFFPIGAGLIAPFIRQVFEAVVQNPTEEQRQQVIEKTECLLEDVFSYHVRNENLGK